MATPNEATKRAADKSMAGMRSRGNVGHQLGTRVEKVIWQAGVTR